MLISTEESGQRHLELFTSDVFEMKVNIGSGEEHGIR